MLELELELEGISEDLDNILDFCYRESGFGFESESGIWSGDEIGCTTGICVDIHKWNG